MNTKVSSFFHIGAVAGIVRIESRARGLGIALSGGLQGSYTRGPIGAGIGGGSVPSCRRLKT